MKKVLTAICSALLIAVFALTMAGCSSYGKIEKAFVNKGYTVSTNLEKYQDKLLEALNAESEEEAKAICTIHLLTKNDELTGLVPTNYAFIFEFSSTKEMNEKINESETLKGLIKDVQNSDLVNGNCVLFPLSLDYKGMTEIFKNA